MEKEKKEKVDLKCIGIGESDLIKAHNRKHAAFEKRLTFIGEEAKRIEKKGKPVSEEDKKYITDLLFDVARDIALMDLTSIEVTRLVYGKKDAKKLRKQIL